MTNDRTFPDNWRISEDYDPNQHMLSLKGKDYLTVQNRLLWFVRDQRELIMRGLATMPYIIRTELVDHDRDAGYAQFRTYVRDVLGNEATMYGSETVRDFGDYAEKASTKSLGRALLLLGYGTGMAPEMDEGERVVDAPVERRRSDAPARPPSPPARRDTSQTQTHENQQSASDPLTLTHASAQDQRKLVETLRATGYTSQTGVEALLLHVTGRPMPAAGLLSATSDLSYAELAKVNEFLTRVSANGKAAAQAKGGGNG